MQCGTTGSTRLLQGCRNWSYTRQHNVRNHETELDCSQSFEGGEGFLLRTSE
jgi:hypothetical protein